MGGRLSRAAWVIFIILALCTFGGFVGANFGRDTTEFHILGAIYLVGAIMSVGFFLVVMAIQSR